MVRRISVTIHRKGFRTHKCTLLTTLIDADTYSSEDIAQLYARRWGIELDIRSIKQTIGMARLTCESPQMVKLEAWACMLAYNLTRRTIAQSAIHNEKCPRAVSFAAAVRMIHEGRMLLSTRSARDRKGLIELLMSNIQKHRVANRPGRVEPRLVKRRSNKYGLLTVPRNEARLAELNE